MNDDKIIGNRKHLYDESIKYDESHLPISYDMKFDEFEVMLRMALNHYVINEYDYKKLTAKYGWLYD